MDEKSWIMISTLQKKLDDLDLHCFQVWKAVSAVHLGQLQ